jgi:rubrerythrin
VDIVTTLQNAIEIAGKLRALSKKVEDAEFKMLLADLSNELADAKLEVANLKSELAETRTELLSFQQRQETKDSSKPYFVEGAYEFDDIEGSFCTACFDSKGKKSRLSKLQAPFDSFGKWECPVCKAILS